MKRIPIFVLFLTSFAFPQTTPKITYIGCGSLYDGKHDEAQKNVTVKIVGDKIDSISQIGRAHV